jgi:hypothetical protein
MLFPSNRLRHCGCRCRCIAQFGDRVEQLLAMAERRDANLLEIVASQPTQQPPIDVVGAERLGILGKTDPGAVLRRVAGSLLGQSKQATYMHHQDYYTKTQQP